jgi:glycosyltransferase involved in cell wall biosynthesis
MTPLVAIDGRDAFAPEARGWGRYARCLIDALSHPGLADGLEFDVIRDGGAGPELAFEQLKLPLLLRRRAAALVHVTNCFLPLRRPCPGVVTIHDLAFDAWPEDFAWGTGIKYRLIVPLAARSAELVIVPSEFTRRDLWKRYGIEPSKVRVIPEAPALALGDAPAESGVPYVLAVGDLRRKKNVGALVRGFAELHRERAIEHRLVLAGADRGEAARLRALAGDAPVELRGYVSDGELDALIRGAELLVNPSLYEGFGLVVLEAMVRGTPVLAARAGALPEVGGEAAAYFEVGEEDGLKTALRNVLGDPGRRARMSALGIEWASRFSWERTARETVEVYRELI